MEVEDMCDTGLLLGLGFEGWAASPLAPADRPRSRREASCVKVELREPALAGPPVVDPSLTLSLSDGAYHRSPAAKRAFGDVNTAGNGEPRPAGRQSPPHSMVSSFSNAYPSSSIKKEKDVVSEEVEAERVSSRVSDEEEGNARKKLRLTKDQSALLEDRFKEHSTLNPKQKQALAKQLNLRPRQVEVWFQNRRARTKLKQTEVDCEFLKRCCESLTDENRRLQKELQELRALTFAQPLYMQLPAATLTMCPSCERMAAVAGDAGPKGGVAAGGPFGMAPKPHFCNPFTTSHPPSAAC
ncbi:hypothetical protein Taro_008302 [Colocasia esculenta]|uniref:Homeobox domain-containing protein n=1 Tax=Colocasia esculenta TaxID=4460 RepID=A0A843U209_COLES|nr:hypothetical protein [Colocasia esculenta]